MKNKYIILYIIFVIPIITIIQNGCIMGENRYYEYDKFQLSDSEQKQINKIIIKTRKDYTPHKKIIIEDKNDINFIFQELSSLEETPFVLLECPYIVSFQKNRHVIQKIELSVIKKKSGRSFIRLNRKDGISDYLISQKLSDFFVETIGLNRD